VRRRPKLPAWLARFGARLGRSRRTRPLAVALGLVVLWLCFGGAERQTWPRQQVLDAIRHVESGDRAEVPDGDGGLAIGPYQIHRVYWQDALAFRPTLGGDYQDCRDRAYAERVVDAYMSRWLAGPWQRGEAEAIARAHNGGPRGADNPKTDGYWRKVRARLP
jgi:hypothetical protein